MAYNGLKCILNTAGIETQAEGGMNLYFTLDWIEN